MSEEVLKRIQEDVTEIKSGLLGDFDTPGLLERTRRLEVAEGKRDRVLWGLIAGTGTLFIGWVRQTFHLGS